LIIKQLKYRNSQIQQSSASQDRIIKMKTGVVKWFNNAKGYGFILSDEENQDVFAHYSSIEMEGYRTLRAGQCVAFEAIDGPKGLHAMSIQVLEEVTLTGVTEEVEQVSSPHHTESEGAGVQSITTETLNTESPVV
jgi:CspA family cold shock protein